MAACEALVSLTCLSEAKLAIVKQHPQVRSSRRGHAGCSASGAGGAATYPEGISDVY